MTSHYLSSEEVAKQLDITVDAVNELREAFKIRAFRDGAGWRFRAEDVEKYRTIRDAASTSGDSGFNADSSDSERGSSSSEIPLGDGSGSFSAFLMDDSPSADLTSSETNAAGSSVSIPLSDSSSSVDIAKAMSQVSSDVGSLNLEEEIFNDELNVDDTGSDSIDVNRLVQDGGSGSIRLSSPELSLSKDTSTGSDPAPELSLSKESETPSESSEVPELSLSKEPESPSESSEVPELSLSKESETPSESSEVAELSLSTDFESSSSLKLGEPASSESVDLEVALQPSKPSSGIDSGLTLDKDSGVPGTGGIDSGLNLDETTSSIGDPLSLELDDSDLLTLDALGESSRSSSSASASVPQLQDEFSLTPEMDDDSSEDSASSSRVIPLNLPETPTATIATGTPGFPTTPPATGSVLGDDPFGMASPAAPQSPLGESPLGSSPLDSSPLGGSPFGGSQPSGFGTSPMGTPQPGGPGTQPIGTQPLAPPQAPYSGLQITSLIFCALLLFIDGWLLYDLVGVLSTDHQPTVVSDMLLNTLSGLFK